MTKRAMFSWAIFITVALLALVVYTMLTSVEPRAVVYGRDGVTQFFPTNAYACGGDKLTFDVTILAVNDNSTIDITRSWAALDVPGLPKNLMLESLTTTGSGIMRGDFEYSGPVSRVVPDYMNSRPGLYEYREMVENGSSAMYYVQFIVPESCKEEPAP